MSKYTLINGDKVTELLVLHSGGGYYIGRLYLDPDFNCELPYSRESVEYYPTESTARYALDNKTYTERMWD